MPPHPPRSGAGGTPSAIQASMAALGLDDPAWMPREIKSTLPPLKLTLDGSSSGRWVPPPPKPDVDLSALQSADIPGGLYVALDGHAGSSNVRSLDAFNTFGPGKASGIVGQQLELDQDEGKYKDEEDIDAWRPREIKSTLPPLEIKELPSTLPPLKISSSSASGSGSGTGKSRTPLPAGPAVASRDGKLAPVNTRPKAPDLLSTIAAAMLEETYDPGLGAIYDIPSEDRGVYITLTPLQGGGRNDFGAMAGAGAIGGTLELYSNAKGETTDADWAKSAQASVGWQSEVAKITAKSGGSTAAAPAADTEIPALPPPWAVPLPPPPSRSKAAPTSSSSSLPSLPSATPPPSLISIDASPANPPTDMALISPVELPTTMPPLRLEVPTSIRPTPDMKPVPPRAPLPAGSSLAASTKPPAGQQPLKTVAVMPFDAVNHEVVDFDRGVYIALAPLETDPEDGLESKGDTFGANYGLHLVGGQLEISEAAKTGVTSLKEQVEREARAREEKMRREWDAVGGFGNYGTKADARVSSAVGEVPLDTVAELAGLGEQPRGMYVPVDPGTADGRRVVSLIGRKIDDDDEQSGTKSAGKVAESALPSIPPPPSFSVSPPTFVPPIPSSLTVSYAMTSATPGVLVGLPGATVVPEDVVELPEDFHDRGMYVALEDVTGNDDGGDGLGGPRHSVHAVIGRKLSIEG